MHLPGDDGILHPSELNEAMAFRLPRLGRHDLIDGEVSLLAQQANLSAAARVGDGLHHNLTRKRLPFLVQSRLLQFQFADIAVTQIAE